MSSLTHRLRRSPTPPSPRTPADAEDELDAADTADEVDEVDEVDDVDASPPARKEAVAQVEPDQEPEAAPRYLRFGSIGLRSALAYLLVWALVLFVVTLAVFAVGYAALERFGVLASLSESAATVLSQPLPDNGILPALEFDALLPYALLGAGGLSLLWLCGSFAFVCVHNAVSTLTSGLRVRMR